MFHLSLILVLSFAAIVFGSGVAPRIVGGSSVAYESQFPHVVSLRNTSNIHFCAASIINDYWIVTAAQCMRIETSFIIVVGSIRLTSSGTYYLPNQIIIHPNFNRITLVNDIALVSTYIPIEMSTHIQPIPISSQFINITKSATITGWGQISSGQQPTTVLQYLAVQTISNEHCKQRHLGADKRRIVNSTICAVSNSWNYNKGTACFGDTGSPLFDDEELIGFVSWYIPCATTYPDVFTRISSYYDWIIEKTRLRTN